MMRWWRRRRAAAAERRRELGEISPGVYVKGHKAPRNRQPRPVARTGVPRPPATSGNGYPRCLP